MKPALSAVYSGLTRVPLYTDAVLERHVQQPRHTHTDAFQFAPDASDDDDDDIDAAPAEPAHSSCSATSTSAAGEDVSSSTQPFVTNAAELCDVCLIALRSGVALVPCGHSRFCGDCADTVAAMDIGCPLCRTLISMVLRVFN